jgi:hypothetical protein
MILVVATINLHHFIVDAYIWRFRASDSNRGVIEERSGEASIADAA